MADAKHKLTPMEDTIAKMLICKVGFGVLLRGACFLYFGLQLEDNIRKPFFIFGEKLYQTRKGR